MTVEQQMTLPLPADSRSPQRARDFVAAALDAWEMPQLRNEARLLTSELVTNAVMYARTEVVVTVARDDQRQVVRVTVVDGSQVQPRRRRYSELATTGRGLAMVSEAAAAFGTTTLPEGKAVWFELPVSSAASSSQGGDRT